MKQFSTETLSSKNLSPKQKIKRAVLANRLKVSVPEADRILNEIAAETAKILELPTTRLTADTEFAGRSLDLVFTIKKQSAPK